LTPELPSTRIPAPARPRELRFRLLALLLALGAGIAYHSTWQAPFVLDDSAAITENATLRALWPLSGPLSPPTGGLPISGRPLVNLSYALNHAISGDAVWSYHATNFALHLLAGLTLFAVLRRTLARPVVDERIRRSAEVLAFFVSALWLLHPLQTAAVTYVSQRSELLVSLCYLLMLYAIARAAATERRGGWWGALAIAACLAGMASKEVMVSAPLVALLYDRTFFAGNFATAWRARWKTYLGMMASWALLAWLVFGTAGRGGTAGFGLDMTPLRYAVTQTFAITRYLGLAFWPSPLVFDYGMFLVHDARVIVPCAVLVAGLVGLTLVALRTRPVLGFAGALFFAVLAPSSSIIPVATQTMAEHRMYLPLGVVLVLTVSGLWYWGGRWAMAILAAAVVAAGVATGMRNTDYATPERLWRDTVRKWPANARAHNNFASILLARGEAEVGRAELEEALRLDPRYADALLNLSRAELEAGRVEQALVRAEAAQRVELNSAAGWGVVGSVQLAAGRLAAAKTAWTEALRLRPDWAEAHFSLGNTWLRLGEPASAAAEYGEAVRLKPEWGAAHQELAGALNDLGRTAEALPQAREAVRLSPDSADALFVLGNSLFGLDRAEESAAAFQEVLRRKPDYPNAVSNYANALLLAGRSAEALAQFDTVLRRDGPSAPLLCSRAVALLDLGRLSEGATAVAEALRLEPDFAPALALQQRLAAPRP
jgi:tetratricopeptide (TPR) repeat protein